MVLQSPYYLLLLLLTPLLWLAMKRPLHEARCVIPASTNCNKLLPRGESNMPPALPWLT